MVKRLSPKEVQLRREKGLCFTCDEKYSPSHRYPNKQYLWLHVEEEVASIDLPNDNTAREDNLEPLPHSEPHLSFNTLKGFDRVVTMRFKGLINGLPVQILLDS